MHYKGSKIIEPKQSEYRMTTSKIQKGGNSEEDPKKIYVDNVCYWYEAKGYLIGSQKGKAKRFIQLDLLKEISQDKFECLPLPGNKQTHILEKKDNEWTCTCQRNKRLGKICSHIDAIKLKLFMIRWNKGGY